MDGTATRETLGFQAEIKQLESGYREYLGRGADVIETDIPALLAPMLYGKAAVPARLTKWMEVRERTNQHGCDRHQKMV